MSFRRFLETIGLILAPAGIVAILCQLANVPSKINVIASAFIILIASICLIRTTIDARIPAIYLAVFCAILSGIFVIYLATNNNTGAVPTNIYPKSSQFQNDVDKYFESSQSEIWILATNVHAHLPAKIDQVLSRLKLGVKVKYLVFDPFSPDLPLLAKSIGASAKDVQSQCLFSTYSLLRLSHEWEIYRKASPNHGELEIRFYEDIPHSRLYVFDPNSATGTTVLVPYMSQHSSMTLPAMVFSNGNRDSVKEYFASFEKLWENAIPLDTILQSHPELNSP